MTLALIGIAFGLVFFYLALRADARFRKEARLPMQWWLDGQVTWSAPRRLALAFVPSLSLLMLGGFGVLLANAQPRPGQENMVLPAYVALGLISLGAQILHLWLISKTVQRNGS